MIIKMFHMKHFTSTDAFVAEFMQTWTFLPVPAL